MKMGESPIKVEFALGSEVSPGHFFKSNFARQFVTGGCHQGRSDSKSLDYEFLDNGTIIEEPELNLALLPNAGDNGNNNNGNFYSLVNFGTTQVNNNTANVEQQTPKRDEDHLKKISDEKPELCGEIERLRKKCNELAKRNEGLQRLLEKARPGQVQVIDNVCLQNQIATLQWQLKQNESTRQMYHSLLEQVVRFLDRCRKSMGVYQEKMKPSRVPRSRSVHGVHSEISSSAASCASSTTSSSSSESYSRSSWSILSRRSLDNHKPNGSISGVSSALLDPKGSDPKKLKSPEDTYRRPKQKELDPNDIPPEKLSQEAFRLMRTVQSLLSMREPDLSRLDQSQDLISCTSQIDLESLQSHRHHHSRHSPLPVHETSLPIVAQPDVNNFANSTILGAQDDSHSTASSQNNQTISEIDEPPPRILAKSVARLSLGPAQLTSLMSPRTRQSIDTSSLNSSTSSKTTEDEEVSSGGTVGSIKKESIKCVEKTSASNNPVKKIKDKRERKESNFKSFREWAFGASSAPPDQSRPVPTTSPSSAEDESGFSSLSSFQEVGLPLVTTPPLKGCHTEVGLPEVPAQDVKIRHRRWSSTPVDFHAIYKRHSSSSFDSSAVAAPMAESQSVWV